MADITFSMTSDEKDVVKSLQNVVRENEKLRQEILRGVDQAKSAAAQEREWQKLREKAAKETLQQQQALQSAAQKIRDSLATPYEEASKKVEELRKHLAAGTLTTDEYRKAYARVAKELKEATRDHAAEAQAAADANAKKAEAAKKAMEAERAHAAAVREATSVVEKYATKEERAAATIAKLNDLKAKGVLSSKDHARAIEAETKKLSETGDAADKSGGLVGGLTGKMTAFVGGLASATTAISLLRNEYDALIERQGKARDANIGLAGQQEALLMNLGGADAAGVLKNIQDLSVKSGVKEENITAAVNDAMAARADLGVDQVVNAVGSVSKIRKLAPQEMAGLAAATIDTQKQTGLGTDQSLGFLLQLQGQARTKNLKFLAENFTPAVGGVMNFGADRQTAGALLSSLSHGMGDTTGAMSATSAIQLSKQLRSFAPGQDIGKSIEALQRDPELREKFLAGASFEAKALPAVESLLSGGTQAKQFEAARKALSADPTTALNDAIKARTASPSIGLAELDLSLGNVTNQIATQDKRGAESAIVRERMAEIRKQMGGSDIGNRISGLIDEVTSNGMHTGADAVGKLEQQSKLLSQGRDAQTEAFRSSRGMAAGPAQFDAMVKANLENPEFVRQAKLMEQMVALLKTQLELQQKANAEQQQAAHAGVVAARAREAGQ